MSATRDKSQKIAFIYTNLYQVYKKGKDAAVAADVQPEKAEKDSAKAPNVHELNKGELAFVRPFGAEVSSDKTRFFELKREQKKTKGVVKNQVIKTEDKNAQPHPYLKIQEYKPLELAGKRIQVKRDAESFRAAPAIMAKPAGAQALPPKAPVQAARAQPMNPQQSEAIQSLKRNLDSLNDLHGRLRFMLQELEDLVKE